MFIFDYFFLFNLKRTVYCWWVCLRPSFKKFKSLVVFFVTYIGVLCGGFVVYWIMAEVAFWNEIFFSSGYDYMGNEMNCNWLRGHKRGQYSAAAEMPWSRKRNKDKFHYSFFTFTDHPRKRRLVSRRIASDFDAFTSSRYTIFIFDRIDALSRTKFSHFPNKQFPMIGRRLFFYLYSGRIPKHLYFNFPQLQKKPSGRFGVWRGISVPNPRFIYKRPDILGDYITYILSRDFYLSTLLWNKGIHKNNLLGYRILPLGVLPIEDGFFTKGGSRLSEFLKGSRVKVFDFQFFELSLLHPGLAIDKRNGSGMVVSFVHPAFYNVSRNIPVNDFFRDYIRQIKTTGLRDSVISLYLTLIFSDPDMFCYYLPRAVKFVFVDYSVAQAQFLRANSHMFFPVSHWNKTYVVNNRHEPSVHLQTARSFIYRIARKQ